MVEIKDATLGIQSPKPLGEGGPNLHYFVMGEDVFALMP